MPYETILYEKEDGLCVITLNRPKSLNALNIQMWTDLDKALDEIDQDAGWHNASPDWSSKRRLKG